MKQEHKDVIAIIVFVVLMGIGGFIGYVVGDYAIQFSNEVRPKDWIEMRVVYPFIGMLIFIAPSLKIASKIN